MGFLFIFPLLIVILAVLASCIRIVPQAQALVVERLGAYLDTWSVVCIFWFRLWTAWQKR